MKSRGELIDELASLCGIVFEYWDFFGNRYVASFDTKEAILRSMKLKIDTPEQIIAEIIKIHDKPWLSVIEPVKVISINNQPFRISVYITLPEWQEKSLFISCLVEDEYGRSDEFAFSWDSLHLLDQKWINGQRYIKTEIYDIAHRDIGYYTLFIKCISAAGEFSGRTRIIITPDTCYIPPIIQDEYRKLWGITINLYSINSERNWGCGDFTDLNEMLKWLFELGGDFIAVNPLHALSNKMPYDISPYSPISRLYKNFIYLDIERLPDVTESDVAQVFMRKDFFKAELERLRNTDLIDYEAIAALKESILRYAFEIFYERHYKKATQRWWQFEAYLKEEGKPLQSFCLYLTLYKKNNLADWKLWGEEYRSLSEEILERLIYEHEKEILFYSYIQWLIDLEIKNLSEFCKQSSPLGLMFDLAIGSTSVGSDVWDYQDVFALGIKVGAPPDDFNPTGQDWGFPPLIPQILRYTGYEFFIQTIRKTMKHAGALRIDHALGMFRLFWIPEGRLPTEGAYVVYPSEDLLRIIALESVRNKTLVVAEDLGTVGENVYDRLQGLNMLSYKLLYFERNYPDPSFKPPWAYPQKALCAITTHDLPTCTGFWAANDIELKKTLGLYVKEDKYLKHLSERKRDKELLLRALNDQGILHEDYLGRLKPLEMSQYLCLAIYEYLARTPCMLVSVSLDDIIGTVNQQNLPGVVETYPCWRQKTPVKLEEIISADRFKMLGEIFKRNNR